MLASRLSFFLWSSIPHDELLDLAIRGELSWPDVLEGQVIRVNCSWMACYNPSRLAGNTDDSDPAFTPFSLAAEGGVQVRLARQVRSPKMETGNPAWKEL